MTKARLFSVMFTSMVSISLAACGSENKPEAPVAAPPTSAPAVPMAAPATAKADNPCPLTVEQVAAITGVPMTMTGACTFFPANGRDIPHIFYVRQNPMVCNTIKPGDIGFTETVAGLPAKAAYVRDQLDGSHVLVCPNDNARAFDIVVEIRNDKPKNREAAIALAKQVLAGR